MRTRGAAATNGQMDTLDAALSTVYSTVELRTVELRTVELLTTQYYSVLSTQYSVLRWTRLMPLSTVYSTVEPAHTARIKKLDTVHSAAMCSTHSVLVDSQNKTTQRTIQLRDQMMCRIRF